jgi:hypothetical protein
MDLEFVVSTDTEHEIVLDSHIVSAVWRGSTVCPGQKALFEISTAFVGNGAQMRIEVKTGSGRELGKISAAISNNRYCGAFDVPHDVEPEDEVHFEFELPKNGLSGESNRVPVVAPIVVSNMRWSAKEVRRGDIVTLSANTENIRSGSAVTLIIYEYDQYGAHDRVAEIGATLMDSKISVQWQFEYPGDTDDIPTESEMRKYGRSYCPPLYFFTVRSEETEFGRDRSSGMLMFVDWIAVELVDSFGNERYALRLPDGTKRKGRFDENGNMREDGVPPGRYTIEIWTED